MSENEKAGIKAEIDVIKDVFNSYLKRSKAEFLLFVENGNDAHRQAGNKWGACAKDLQNTVERLDKILTA